MNPFSLDQRTILVTGASSGIGRACAVQIAAQGAHVVLSGRSPERLQGTAALIAAGATTVSPCDLVAMESRGALVDALPPLDGVVHCAGTNALRPVKFFDGTFVRESLGSNFEVPLLLTAELLKKKKLKRGASLVFITSISASVAMPGNAAYSAAKAAILGALRVLAVEIAPQCMRANAISPGQVSTPMTERTAAHISPEALAENLKQYPLGLGQPDDVAHAAVFLLSGASRWMTGAEMVLDGGYTLR
jgi:NAD(P)-dependent dehydrogenase (short-subunit alcohol dehydrogenase family)